LEGHVKIILLANVFGMSMEMCRDRGGGKWRWRQKYVEMENVSVLLYFDDLHNISYACTYSKRNKTCPYYCSISVYSAATCDCDMFDIFGVLAEVDVTCDGGKFLPRSSMTSLLM
jgi:hypothetical protein